jgi:ribose transport system ATP-binding protein
MIYQELSLAPHLSVMDNIVLGMEPVVGPLLRRRAIVRRASAAMAQLGRPDIPLHLPVSRLGIAERQLVEIARALAVGCRVLVLDEPTSSLTRQDIVRLFDLVRRLRASGQAIIYISHFLEEVKEISDRFTVLRDGATVGGGMTRDASSSQIVSLMVGRDVRDLYPRSRRTPGEIVLSVRALRGVKRPESASFDLRAGEILGVAGLIGAGRTEMLRTIFGLDDLRAGQINVATRGGVRADDGAALAPQVKTGAAGPARRWAQGVGMVSEDRKSEGLALDLTIADNITMSCLPALALPSRQDAHSRRWIDALSLRCKGPRQRVRDLSGGNQQKAAIARLLHHRARILLLDEPTRGIDVGSKAQIYKVIDELAREGKAIIIVSSYLPELMGVCDRIAVMHRGVLGPARNIDQTSERQIMLEATGAANGADPVQPDPAA